MQAVRVFFRLFSRCFQGTRDANKPKSNGAKTCKVTLTGVNDADYLPPFTLIAKLNKLILKVNRPKLSPEDIKKLETAMRNNKSSE